MALTERYVTSTGTDTYANSTNIATPMSLTTATGSAVAGDRINIKAGTYTRTASDTLTNAGTATSPIIYRGYSSTIGDGYLGRTNGNGALITTNMPVIAYNSTFRWLGGTFVIVESLSFTGNVNSSLGAAGTDGLMKSCTFANASTAASASAGGAVARSKLFDCDLSLTGATAGAGSAGCIIGVANAMIVGCRINGNKGIGIASTAFAGVIAIVGNVIYDCTGVGISIGGTANVAIIINNTIVGGGSDAINIVTGATGLQHIHNNLITDNTGNGINMVSTGNAAFVGYNRTRDNGAAIANGGDWITATTYSHVTTDTGGPETDYVASASDDYRLISASPARATGWFPSSDIGALQYQEAMPELRIPSFPTI